MEQWEFDFEWLQVRHLVRDSLGQKSLPNFNAILMLIGVQELGRWQSKFSKEEKQDLMHIAVCRLLSYDGFYEFEGRDADGWPHWKQLKLFKLKGVKEQERFLKEKMIKYFKDWRAESVDSTTQSN